MDHAACAAILMLEGFSAQESKGGMNDMNGCGRVDQPYYFGGVLEFKHTNSIGWLVLHIDYSHK